MPDTGAVIKIFVSYNYRLFDRYDESVVSLAILGDQRSSWRPHQYTQDLWGCRTGITFPVIKLLDYQDNWPALEASVNLFAVVVMAHLRTQTTRRDAEDRLQWKLRLVRQLYERGLTRSVYRLGHGASGDAREPFLG